MKLSFIFEFQLVPFVFSLILGETFMLSPAKVWEGGDFFSKKCFSRGGGKFIRGIALHRGTKDQIMLRGGGVSKNVFSSNLNTLNLEMFPNHGEYSIEDKALTIL